MEEHEKIEIRSEEVQEILGAPPHWIVQWGNVLVFLILITLVVLSYYFKYPDKVSAPVVVTTSVPPVDIIAEQAGYLTNLSVIEGDSVKKGDVLAVIQNPGAYKDILFLEEKLEDINWEKPSQVVLFDIDELEEKKLQLGDVQSQYSNFIQKYKELSFKKSVKYDRDQIRQLKRNENIIRDIIERQQERRNLAIREQKKKESDLVTKGKLLAENLISQDQYFSFQQEVSSAKAQVKSIDETIDGYKLQIQGIKNEIEKIKAHTKSDDTNQFVALQENLSQLKNSILKWKQNYLLTANRTGTVSFFNDIWSEEQYIKAGDELMAIIPLDKSEESSKLIARAALPIYESGKVQVNQRVLIKFESYPYQEFGVVEGQVLHKSKVPKDKSYLIEIAIPQNLETTYGENLTFEQEMVGVAEIITKDKRFIERVFEKLLSAFRNS